MTPEDGVVSSDVANEPTLVATSTHGQPIDGHGAVSLTGFLPVLLLLGKRKL